MKLVVVFCAMCGCLLMFGCSPSETSNQSLKIQTSDKSTAAVATPTPGSETMDISVVKIAKPSLGQPLEESKNIAGVTTEISMVPSPFTKDEIKPKAGKFIYAGKQLKAYHQFDGWKTLYFYNSYPDGNDNLKFSGVASGARTTNNEGKIVAEAKMVKLEKGTGIVIEEFHYNPDGSVGFYCKSRFLFDTDQKTDEFEAQGKKKNEYYLVWPLSAL